MIKKVLVVGGAGYIGGSVTDSLIRHHIPFSVYDNLTYEPHYLKPVSFTYGDVRDREKLGKSMASCSHVIWLAAIVGDGACVIKPILTKQVNQDSVGWLAHKFHGRIIFTSTCSVYGVSSTPVSETSLTHPLSVYAQTKLAAEHYLDKKNSLIFRLGTAFGISDTYSRIRMDLAINYMTMNALRRGKLTIFGGNQWRPFIHVKDIGNIIVRNLDSSNKGIYNLTTQNSTILEVAKIIQHETKCKIGLTDKKFQDDRSYHAITDKALHDKVYLSNTNFTIKYGIKEIKELVLSNRIKNLDLEQYSNERHLLSELKYYEKIH